MKILHKKVQGTLETLRGEDLDEDEELPDAENMAALVNDLNKLLDSEPLEAIGEDLETLQEHGDAAIEMLEAVDKILDEIVDDAEGRDDEEGEEDPEE